MRDQVCLTENGACANNIAFLGVNQMQSSLKNLRSDGILGLAPSRKHMKTELFLDNMKKGGAIDKRVFAFLIG